MWQPSRSHWFDRPRPFGCTIGSFICFQGNFSISRIDKTIFDCKQRIISLSMWLKPQKNIVISVYILRIKRFHVVMQHWLVLCSPSVNYIAAHNKVRSSWLGYVWQMLDKKWSITKLYKFGRCDLSHKSLWSTCSPDSQSRIRETLKFDFQYWCRIDNHWYWDSLVILFSLGRLTQTCGLFMHFWALQSWRSFWFMQFLDFSWVFSWITYLKMQPHRWLSSYDFLVGPMIEQFLYRC
jgi:hypothetical protein